MTDRNAVPTILLSALSDARAEEWERWGPSRSWAKVMPHWDPGRPNDQAVASVVEQGSGVLGGSLEDRLDRAEKALGEKNRDGAIGEILTFAISDRRYPASLRSVPYPPWILHLRGDDPLLSTGLAIVGVRDANESDLEAARQVASWAAENGVPVITGMARGVDREAVLAAVKAGGTVIGVVPGGPHEMIPKESRDAYDQAVRSGCVVTEVTRLPRKHPWTSRTAFLRRNRIISGLARVVVVCSSEIKGGSFNQVVWAKRQGCPVIGYAPMRRRDATPDPHRPLGQYHQVLPQELQEKVGEAWNSRQEVVQSSL